MKKGTYILLIIFILFAGCSGNKSEKVDLRTGDLLFFDKGDIDRAFYIKKNNTEYVSSIWNITKELYEKSPSEGVSVSVRTFYTKASKNYLTQLISFQTQSDKQDAYVMSYSIDNGNSYYSFTNVATNYSAQGGTMRRYWQTQIVDPSNDKLVVIFLKGLLPNDNPLEGMRNWTLWYGISTDGGKAFEVEEQIIQKGDQYTPEYPFDGVTVGQNGIMIGDITCVPIKLTRQKGDNNGKILVPVQINPVDEEGFYYNPGGGYTYHYSAVLIGTWNSEGKIDWDISNPVMGNPNKTTRGVLEPTLAEMPNGDILMVMRGSNGGTKDTNYKLNSYKWYSYSEDGGYTWTEPKPWMCDDNTVFFSPSSCSQLIEHSNGKYYWIGNVSNLNCKGNLPRWPLVIGEVDPKSFMLIKDSVMVIDIKTPSQNSSVAFSNFYAREDRISKDILIYCTPLFENGQGDWTSDAYMYTVNIK